MHFFFRTNDLQTPINFFRYVQEGSCVTVIGMLHRNNDIVMIIQPPEAISTGCLWQKLLLPVDIDGLILRASQLAGPVNQETIPHPDR